jgi:transposase
MRLKSGEAREFRWQTIVSLSKADKRQGEIAAILGICQSSVSRVLAQSARGQELQAKRPPGAKSKLSPEQKAALEEILLSGAVSYGFEGEMWTAKRIVVVIGETFGVHYSGRQVNTIVKAMGLSKQRFSIVDSRQSAQSMQDWRATQLPDLKKSPG